MKTVLKHQLPNGEIATRETARNYQYVVIGECRPGSYHNKTYGTTWAVFSWHLSQSLATKQLFTYNHWDNINHPDNLRVEKINGGIL